MIFFPWYGFPLSSYTDVKKSCSVISKPHSINTFLIRFLALSISVVLYPRGYDDSSLIVFIINEVLSSAFTFMDTNTNNKDIIRGLIFLISTFS